MPPTNSKPCRVCLTEHDDEIHAATVSVHDWFHQQVMQSFYDESDLPAEDPDEEMLLAVCLA